MKLIVGLGNPGDKYARTRHNAGFILIEHLARELGAGPWQIRTNFQSLLTTVDLADEKVILVKPQTYMNESGRAVGQLVNYYRDQLSSADIWVIHDDIDLPEGELRSKSGGGSGGQLGVEAIIRTIGPAFRRWRIGIGQNDRSLQTAEEYVLTPLPDSLLLRLTTDSDLLQPFITALT